MISLVVAASTNNVIGRNGELPWRLSADLKRFKQLTMGKPIVMGRLTHESIGKALPGRHNIVISRRPNYVTEGCDVVASPERAIAAAGTANEIMIIGGGEIYRAFLPLADRIHMTRVDVEVDGDAHFPPLDIDEWRQTSCAEYQADNCNEFDYAFIVLERIG